MQILQGCAGSQGYPNPEQRITAYSREDRAFLEAEYLRNQKPSKRSRLRIMSRVSMNERQIQVCYPQPSFASHHV
jgi:hypothetical protein